MNSEVQTGVKSAGWLNRMTQLPSYCFGKSISPCVVTALKAGALSPMQRQAGGFVFLCVHGVSPTYEVQGSGFNVQGL